MTDKTTITSYAVNGLTAIFGMLTMEMVAIGVGITLGLITYATNFYFQKRRDKRELEQSARNAEIHRLKIESYRGKIEKPPMGS